MNLLIESALICCWISLGFFFGLIMGQNHTNSILNDQELRQCLSQSGTTWQGGECVIILKN